MAEHTRFVVEQTLGKLAKWLRVLGFDTLYERGSRAGELLEEDRIVLTRSRRIPEDRGRALMIRSDHYMEQLAQVVQELGLGWGDLHPFTRCLRCNTLLEPIPKTDLPGKVPDYVRETHDRFQRCTDCGRIYWRGSHMENGMKRIQNLFDGQI